MKIVGAYSLDAEFFSDSNLTRIQKILKSGTDPNVRGYNGISFFHMALDNPLDNIRVVRELINAGADVNLPTHLDITPLHFAVYHRKRQVFDALIQSGASVNAKDFLGRTSLHLAVSPLVLLGTGNKFLTGKKTGIINELLKHNADINAVDSNGDTALMVAVKNGKIKGAIQLLFNGANPTIPNNVFETPLHAAFAQTENQFLEIELLLSGASIYAMDRNSQTPLDILLKNGLSTRQEHHIFYILKLIAVKYNITNELKQKLDLFPCLSQFFNKCCDEVDQMRTDFISGNLTMHDFLWDSFNENYSKSLEEKVYKPVIERLIKDIYPEYFTSIFGNIPDSSLYSILKNSCLKRKDTANVTTFSHLFSYDKIIGILSDYLSYYELFCLIAAYSDVLIPESMQNFHERDSVIIIIDSIGSVMYFTEMN